MATLTRLYDFETDRDATPPVAISATKVDAELDQILTETNAADVRLDAIEATGFVTTARLADDAVTGAKISFIDDSIAVTNKAFMIADGTDYSAFIFSGDVTVSNAGVAALAINSVDTAELADDAVTPAEASFVDDSLAATSAHMLVGNGSVFTNVIMSGDATMTSAGVVTIGSSAVATADIIDDAVTGAKISFIDDSIAVTDTAFMIADGSDYSAFVLSGDATCSNAGVVAISTGVIVNADVNSSAAIAYSKLNLSGSVVSADIVAGTIVDSDVNASAAIAATKIHNGTISNTEFGYLNGLTSNIQTQIDGFTAGTITIVDDDNFTLQDQTDQTKDAQFECSGIATGTTRTFTFPDASGVLTLADNTQTLSSKTLTSPVLNGTLSGTAFLDQDTLSSDSAIAVASQQSIKAYVDSQSHSSVTEGFAIAMSVAL